MIEPQWMRHGQAGEVAYREETPPARRRSGVLEAVVLVWVLAAAGSGAAFVWIASRPARPQAPTNLLQTYDDQLAAVEVRLVLAREESARERQHVEALDAQLTELIDTLARTQQELTMRDADFRRLRYELGTRDRDRAQLEQLFLHQLDRRETVIVQLRRQLNAIVQASSMPLYGGEQARSDHHAQLLQRLDDAAQQLETMASTAAEQDQLLTTQGEQLTAIQRELEAAQAQLQAKDQVLAEREQVLDETLQLLTKRTEAFVARGAQLVVEVRAREHVAHALEQAQARLRIMGDELIAKERELVIAQEVLTAPHQRSTMPTPVVAVYLEGLDTPDGPVRE